MKYSLMLLILLSCHTYAQQITVSSGIATYSMKNMKSHGEELIEDFPVDAQYVDKFPAYFYYDLSVTQRLNDNYVGIYASYGSTGGRINHTDYSGSMNADQNVRYFEVGALLGMLLNPESATSSFQLTLRPGVAFGRYQLEFSTRLGDQSEVEQIEFKSTNFGLQPGFSFNKKIWKMIEFHAHTGYNVNLYRGQLQLSSNDNLFLQDKNGKKVTLDWSGFRGAVGLTFNLDK